MGLFGKKKKVSGDSEIEGLIESIKVDLSNNYKDSAVVVLKRLKGIVDTKRKEGLLKDDKYFEYLDTITAFEHDIASFKRTY